MNEEFDYIINAFTKDGDNVNLEVDNLNVGCITSKSNNFNLDSDGNLTVKSITTKEGGSSSNIDFNSIYPVGSIYMSVNNTSPKALFGGEWEQIKDVFLLGCGTTYSNGTTGGEATHTLTVGELPSHTHPIPSSGGHSHDSRFKEQIIGTSTDLSYDFARPNSQSYDYIKTVTITAGEHTHTPANTGDNQSHNNMPPYLAVYMWKRVS